jgi:uncharacterized protein
VIQSVIISDASCLIALQRIGKLEILPSVFERVLAPPAVIAEFGKSHSFLEVVSPSESKFLKSIRTELGAGESEAIILALELGFAVILDDKKARNMANTLGAKTIGTIGVLIQAKKLGIIATLKPVLDAFDAAHFYVSQSVRRKALSMVGEE